MSNNEIVTKADLSRELRVSPSRISHLVKAGLPTRQDGRVDRVAALEWIKQNCSSHGGGWHLRGEGGDISSRAAAALEGAQREAVEPNIALPAFLRSKIEVLPVLLLRWGISLEDAIVAAEAADMILCAWIAEVGPELAHTDERALPAPDVKQLAKQFGVRVNVLKLAGTADERLDRLVPLLYPESVGEAHAPGLVVISAQGSGRPN